LTALERGPKLRPCQSSIVLEVLLELNAVVDNPARRRVAFVTCFQAKKTSLALLGARGGCLMQSEFFMLILHAENRLTFRAASKSDKRGVHVARLASTADNKAALESYSYSGKQLWYHARDLHRRGPAGQLISSK